MVTYEQMVYVMESILVLAILYAFREQIVSKMYGVRFKRWVEIDTGRQGYTILTKSLNSCSIMGMQKSVSRENINHGIIYFTSEISENMKVESDGTKYTYYINSEEFDTVYKNKLLSNLMMSMEKNMMIIITVLVFIAIAIGIYNAYVFSQSIPKMDFIVWGINTTVNRGG